MRFMGTEWFEAVAKNLSEDPIATQAMANADIRLQQVATGGPDGDVKHFLRVDRGDFEIGLGELEDAAVTLTASYEDSCAIHRGELDPMAAFSSGRMLVQGDLAVLMTQQAVINQMNAAMEALRDATEY